RCCSNLLDFYRRCGALDKIRFFDEYYFVEPGGRVSRLKAGLLPPPLHFTGSFLRFAALGWLDKLAIARGLRAMRRESRQADLEAIPCADWLATQSQPRRAIERFWRPVIVSALNEEPERASAQSAFQVFQQGFLAKKDGYHRGVPAVPLAELYSNALEKGLG